MRRAYALLLAATLFSLPFGSAYAEEYEWYVRGSSLWTKSPFNAITGEDIGIAATGSVSHSWMSGYHGPDGNSGAFCQDCRLTYDCNVAALLVRIGASGRVYCVGSLIQGKAPASGPIYFAINDVPPNDNQGGFDIFLSGPGISPSGGSFGSSGGGNRF